MIPHKRWVAPFRNPRISVRFQLPWAYRRLPRLSSPLDAKSSTVCPYRPDHTCLTPQSTSAKLHQSRPESGRFANGRQPGIRGPTKWMEPGRTPHASRYFSSSSPLRKEDGHSFLSGCQRGSEHAQDQPAELRFPPRTRPSSGHFALRRDTRSHLFTVKPQASEFARHTTQLSPNPLRPPIRPRARPSSDPADTKHAPARTPPYPCPGPDDDTPRSRHRSRSTHGTKA